MDQLLNNGTTVPALGLLTQLTALQDQKRKKQQELVLIDKQITIVLDAVRQQCQHPTIYKDEHYDGHKNNIYYFCCTCDHVINQISDKVIVT